jgi:hypothetical protein
MGKLFHGGVNVGMAILLSGVIGSAMAYQQNDAMPVKDARAASAEARFSSEKSGTSLAEKPEKCYLALHLEIVGAPFANRIADTPAGLAHGCAMESPQRASENTVNSQ